MTKTQTNHMEEIAASLYRVADIAPVEAVNQARTLKPDETSRKRYCLNAGF